jgi:hypothetical protein
VLLSIATSNCLNFTSNKTQYGGFLRTDFVQELVATFNPDVFVETGTFNGMNAKTIAPYFKQIHTVELSRELYEQARSALAGVPNVSIYWGNSPELIAQLAPQLKGHVMFWLDAHYSGENTAMSNDDTNDPEAITSIRKELKAIKDNNLTNCTILIDDIRGFGTIVDDVEYLGCWAYPSVQEVYEMGKQINPNFVCALLGDILLMYDATKFSPNISSVAQACTESRLYDGRNLSDDELLMHEQVIMHAQGAEKDFIIDLYHRMTDWKDPMFHHDLWYGLVSMGSGDWQEALVGLSKVPHRLEYFNKRRETVSNPLPYNHWRIQKYMDEIKAHIGL